MSTKATNLRELYETLVNDESHLKDTSTHDIYAADHLNREGPKSGIELTSANAMSIISRLPLDHAGSVASYRVSTRGYNNRLYYASISHPSGESAVYIFKICGRYWHKTKTETEVVGIWLARKYAQLPTPDILAWDSAGTEFGVEYTLMPTLPGIPLDLLWDKMDSQQQEYIIIQLAEMISHYKNRIPEDVVGRDLIGNWMAIRGGTSHDVAAPRVGPTLDGDGPWSTYKSYVKTQLAKQLHIAGQHTIFTPMAPLWPRVTSLIENLDSSTRIIDSTQFTFMHGDLDAQNILVQYDTADESRLTISAILDWEWSGMFPPEEEFFASFGFINDNPSLNKLFWDQLEANGVLTPRTITDYDTRRALYDLKENLAPWYLLDHADSNGKVAQEQLQAASQAVETSLDSLEKMGY